MVKFRLVAVATLTVFLAAAGFAYWRSGRRDEGSRYVTAVVDRGPIVTTVTATGTLNPVTTVQVGTYVSGPIQALDVDFNSPVQKGQRVAKIDPAPFLVKVLNAEANLANAHARVEKDRADLTLKKVTLERTLQLQEQGLVSQSELDIAQSGNDQAVAQLAVDQASVQQAAAMRQEARINLGYTDIVSPVNGVVVSRNVNVGQTVAASFQTPTLFLIAEDLTKMQVDTNVSESDVGGVREGQEASFSVDAFPGQTFVGRVAQVRNAPIVVQNVVTYDVVIAVDNPRQELKPGMTATVVITMARRDNALRVSLRALRFRPDRKPGAEGESRERAREDSVVWVVEPNGERRQVGLRVGIRDEQYAELLSEDLREGDQLAIAFQGAARASAAQAQPPRLGGFGRR